MTNTPQTQAPQWSASQATPWLTQNVAGRVWDAFCGRSIIDDRDLTAPPVSCDDGARYLIAATATGLWSGHDGQMAIAFGANASNGWTFCVVARHGNQLFIRDEGPSGTLIQYDGAAWNLAPEGVDLLDDLADVDFSGGVADGYTMLYDLSNSVWYAGPVPGGGILDDLSDVSATSPTDGYVLTFEQSSGLWVPMAPSGGGGASAFIDLTDVPASYSGKAGQGAFVKNDETGLEFLPITTGGYETLDVDYTDGGNSGTSETDLFTKTLDAGELSANGDRIEAQWAGTFVSSATATRQLRAYFGGTLIFDSGALTLSTSSAWDIFCTITRVSASVVRYAVSMTTQGAALAAYTASGEVTGLTLANAQIIKLTGTAAGVGAASNDIVGKTSYVEKRPFSASPSGSGGLYEAAAADVPLIADYTWVNQGTAAAVDGTNALIFTNDNDGEVHLLVEATPTAPYDYYIRVDKLIQSVSSNTASIFNFAGIVMRDSSDGEFLHWSICQERISGDENNNYYVRFSRWTNPTTISAVVFTGQMMQDLKWLRVNVTSTTVTAYASTDGWNWINCGTETISTFVDTINQIGVGIRANSEAGAMAFLIYQLGFNAPV